MKSLNAELKKLLGSAGRKLSELADSIEVTEPDKDSAEAMPAGPSIEDVALHMSQDPRIEEEKKLAEQMEQEKAEDKIKNRKKLFYIIPAALLIILLISTIPSFVKSKKMYNEAAQLLASGQYEQAKIAFTNLGSYSDSEEQAQYNISYTKATDLMKAAQENDDSALEIVGKKRTSLEDGQSASIILYENAAELFASLGDYKDSISREAACRTVVDKYYEDCNRETYNSAMELLENKKYLAAREIFSSLGSFSDSGDMASECIYERALALLEYAKNNNVRNIYINISDSLEHNTIISMPGESLISLGSDAVLNLKNLCGDDGADLQYDDAAPEGFLPICEGIKNEFESLGNYRDSAAYAAEAETAGDFTREFFTLCKSGQLQAASIWLDTYDDQFENRDKYPALLATFATYCRYWNLYSGDPTLIPLTANIEGESTMIKTLVSISETSIALKIYTVDNREICSMNYLPDSNGFTLSSDEMTLYFATISNTGKFSYSKYYNGMNIGAVEYSPAE